MASAHQEALIYYYVMLVKTFTPKAGWSLLLKGTIKDTVFLFALCFLIGLKSNILLWRGLTQHTVRASLTSRASFVHEDESPENNY